MGTLTTLLNQRLEQDKLILSDFYTNKVSLNSSDYASLDEYNQCMLVLIETLSLWRIADIIKVLTGSYMHREIKSGEIPQFSNFAECVYTTPLRLESLDHGDVSYLEMGKLLGSNPRKEGADLKYGENHAKTAALFGFTSVINGKINLTSFGRLFLKLNKYQQEALIPALSLKIPIIYNFFCTGESEETLLKDISILSETTQKRRLSNIRTLISAVKEGFKIPDENKQGQINIISESSLDSNHPDYLRAMRTKPFLLLAGISGTGKSRIVKQMAFDSCSDVGDLRKDETSPGNYCLIEVKPNWHDSTELLGYESKINGAHYVLTPFVRFLVKAMLYPEVPFFVCLDEMNLAPVEQYFAEFLSVLESRTKVGDRIVSEPLVKAEIFSKYSDLSDKLFSKSEEATHYDNVLETSDTAFHYGKEAEVYDSLKEYGLRIPENVVVIGTVNMDETTHQFSRKVIDRAMTIEMNLPEGNPFMDFYNNASQLVYRENPTSASLYLSTEVKASDVIDALAAANAEQTEWLKGAVATFLSGLNTALDDTPFKVAYRVQNELLLYFYQLWREDNDADWEKLLDLSCDQILMMKVLPRIEGDEELLEKPLERLASFCTAYPEASKKIAEMKSRLDQSHFASFWP